MASRAQLFYRVFKFDVTRWLAGGARSGIAAICNPDEVRRYLRYTGLPCRGSEQFFPICTVHRHRPNLRLFPMPQKVKYVLGNA